MPATTRYSATFDRLYDEDPHPPTAPTLPPQREGGGSVSRRSSCGDLCPSRPAVRAPNNPFQFVKVGSSPLYRKAEEQLKKVKEIKKPEIVNEEEDWQLNLDSWKSRRRKMSADVFRRQEEMRQLETEQQQQQGTSKKTKTFSQMVQARANRSHSLSLSLLSSPLDVQQWEENNNSTSGQLFSEESEENSALNSDEEVPSKRSPSTLKQRVYPDSGLESLSSGGQRAGDTPPDSCSDFSQDSSMEEHSTAVSVENESPNNEENHSPLTNGVTTEKDGTTHTFLPREEERAVPLDVPPVEQVAEEMERLILLQLEQEERDKEAANVFISPVKVPEPPKEKPPPPPVSQDREDVRSEISLMRSHFLGIEHSDNEDTSSVPPPVALSDLLRAELELERENRRRLEQEQQHRRRIQEQREQAEHTLSNTWHDAIESPPSPHREEDLRTEDSLEQRQMLELDALMREERRRQQEREEQLRRQQVEAVSVNVVFDSVNGGGAKPVVPPKPLKKKEQVRRERDRLRQEQEALQRRMQEERRHNNNNPLPVKAPLTQTTPPSQPIKTKHPSATNAGKPIVQKKPSPTKVGGGGGGYNANHWLIQEAELRRLSEQQQTTTPPVLAVSGRKICSHCRTQLGGGAAMIIESLGLCYHLGCFRCCVCRTPLGNGTRGTDVRVRHHKLHCHNCYSNDEAGLKFSQV